MPSLFYIMVSGGLFQILNKSFYLSSVSRSPFFSAFSTFLRKKKFAGTMPVKAE